MRERFAQTGWARFEADDDLAKWVAAARPLALGLAADPEWRSTWLRCGGTWFVGVNALPNGADGAVNGVPLRGRAIDFIKTKLVPDVPIVWDRAQVSVCYPGYPREWEGESPAAFRYRYKRDAAHVDGLRAEGEPKRRFMREFHQFILGIPLSESPAAAAPFVVWEGSHRLVQAAFAEALRGVPVEEWCDVDLTEVNTATRKRIFETCRRVELPAKPGEAYVVHRHALHGVAPWGDAVEGPPEGRVIAYFRPGGEEAAQAWLSGL